MLQEIDQIHRLDPSGNPAGGRTTGQGIEISWQRGPLAADGERRREPNGAFVEGVIAAAIGRLDHYQSTRFACPENADALDHLRAALGRLQERTADRLARDVEGSHEP